MRPSNRQHLRGADDWLRRKKASAALSSSKEPSVIGDAISTSLPTRKITEENPTVIFGERRAQTTPSRSGSKARVSIFQSIEFLCRLSVFELCSLRQSASQLASLFMGFLSFRLRANASSSSRSKRRRAWWSEERALTRPSEATPNSLPSSRPPSRTHSHRPSS
jgi:hypothetical protein